MALFFALSAPILFASVALAADLGIWVLSWGSVQGASDAAAYSAAMAAFEGGSSTRSTTEADAVAAAAGYVNGQSGVSITVNNPPKSGTHTTDSQAWEVLITQTQTLHFAQTFLKTAPTAHGRAVAVPGGATPCVIALGTTGIDINASNGVSVNLAGCSAEANSSSSSDLQVIGGASITASEISLVGGESVNNGGSVSTTSGVKTGATAADNPYANASIPSYDPTQCYPSSYFSFGGSSSSSFSPNSKLTQGTASAPIYVACAGVNIVSSNNNGVTFPSGTYILQNGYVSFGAGGTTVNGTGVNFILTGSPSNAPNGCAFNVTNGQTVNLSGTGSNDMVVWDAATAGNQVCITDTSSGTINGVIYAPQNNVTFGDGATANPTCLQIVASTVTFNGGSKLAVPSCPATVGGGGLTQLVE